MMKEIYSSSGIAMCDVSYKKASKNLVSLSVAALLLVPMISFEALADKEETIVKAAENGAVEQGLSEEILPPQAAAKADEPGAKPNTIPQSSGKNLIKSIKPPVQASDVNKAAAQKSNPALLAESPSIKTDVVQNELAAEKNVEEAPVVEGNLPRKAPARKVAPKQPASSNKKVDAKNQSLPNKQRNTKKETAPKDNPSTLLAAPADAEGGVKADAEQEDIAKVLPEKCVKPKGKFPWNFENAELLSIVTQISQLTCTNWIIAEDVKPKKKISIIGRTAITVDEALRVFRSAMEANELATVKVGNYEKIVKRADAVKQPLGVFDADVAIPRDENMVTGVVDVRSRDEARMVKNLISRAGSVEELGDSVLVINESGANINRILDILRVVHASGPDARIFDVELRYAKASEVQKMLNDLFGSGSDRRGGIERGGMAINRNTRPDEPGPFYKIVVYEPTNRLFIVATESSFKQISRVIEKLDVSPTEGSSQGEIHVHYLSHASAKELTATLTSLSQRNSRDQRPRPIRMPEQELSGELFEGEVKITADETTNSLVIVASRRDYKSLAKVIEKLDRRRKQVFLEAVIMEMEIVDNNSFGLNAFGAVPLPGLGSDAAIIASNPKGAEVAGNIIKATLEKGQGAGLASLLGVIGVVGPTRDLGNGLKFPTFGAVLNAIASNSKSNILATPSMMTMDNKKAEFSSGKRVPYLKGTAGLGTAAIGTLQQVEMENVELKFNVTPHVNAENEIRMEIEQEDNQLGIPRIILGQETPEIQKKSAKTEVVAKDQQSVVIGGLISERDVKSESKVPLLGDIPILGHLFKNTSWEKRRYRLLLVITPTIIERDSDYLKIYNRHMQQMSEMSEMMYGKRVLIYDPSIDYTKKIGPAGRIIQYIEGEMQKTENGGPGVAGEQVIVPEEKGKEEEEEPESPDNSIDIDEEGLDMNRGIESPSSPAPPPLPPANPPPSMPPLPPPPAPPIESFSSPQGGISFDFDEP